jgi:hypothetical protein
MKNITNSLAPFAALVLFGACMASVLGLLVVLMTSFGFGDGLPFLYFQKFSLPALSVSLPIVGMILFAAILLGLSAEREEAVKPTVIEGTANQAVNEEGKGEEHRLKVA